MSVRTLAAGTLAAAGLCVSAYCQNAPSNAAQDPGAKAAEEILKKTLSVYQNAKSYQADWTYLSKRDDNVQRMMVELRAKGPTKLVFYLHPAIEKTDKTDKSDKPDKNIDAIPEVRVVLDGKYAWFENATAKVYYKVALPKNAVSSPLMFFPQMATVGGAERGPDEKLGDRLVAVIFAKTKSGGLSRMEIDPTNNHIARIASDETTGITRTITTLTIDKETFDGDIPDSVFTYKPGKNLKEMQPPPETAAIFGPPTADKPEKDK